MFNMFNHSNIQAGGSRIHVHAYVIPWVIYVVQFSIIKGEITCVGDSCSILVCRSETAYFMKQDILSASTCSVFTRIQTVFLCFNVQSFITHFLEVLHCAIMVWLLGILYCSICAATVK